MAYLVASKGLPRYVRRYLRIFSWKRLANALQVFMSMLAFLGYAQAGGLGAAVHDDGRANELLQFKMPSVSFGQWANEPSARQYVDR